MKLDYNTATHPQFNGNIGAMSWTSTQFPDIKLYDFAYDGLNRLKSATFVNAGLYNTSYTYDANGNIKH